MKKKEKSHSIDYNIEFMRVVACIMVVLIHISNYYCRGYQKVKMSSYVFATFINGISRVSVPIFFMISGALLLRQDVNIKKNWHHILYIGIALVNWSIIYIFWNKLYLNKEYHWKHIFDEPVKKHLWFLYALLGLYLTLPF